MKKYKIVILRKLHMSYNNQKKKRKSPFFGFKKGGGIHGRTYRFLFYSACRTLKKYAVDMI